jgi:hypothetical protein
MPAISDHTLAKQLTAIVEFFAATSRMFFTVLTILWSFIWFLKGTVTDLRHSRGFGLSTKTRVRETCHSASWSEIFWNASSAMRSRVYRSLFWRVSSAH